MQEIPWKPPKRPLPGASGEEMKEYREKLINPNFSSRNEIVGNEKILIGKPNEESGQKRGGGNFSLILLILFFLFIVGIFTNWFGLGKDYKTPTINLDCSKAPDKYSQYCSEEWQASQNDLQNQSDAAPRIINP